MCVRRYLGDGRFHLESIMIANPEIPAYRYRQTKWQFVFRSVLPAPRLSHQKFTGGHNRLSRQRRRDKIARVPL